MLRKPRPLKGVPGVLVCVGVGPPPVVVGADVGLPPLPPFLGRYLMPVAGQEDFMPSGLEGMNSPV